MWAHRRWAKELSLGHVATILLGLSQLVGCGGGGSDGSAGATDPKGKPPTQTAPTDRRFRIVTTVAMVTDIVREVAGDRAEVIGLLGEGVDPHSYKPTREDVRQLSEADVVFYSGLSLEGRMGDAFARVGRTGKPVYAVTEDLPEDFLREPPEFAGHFDPHVWMDPSAWSRCVRFVAKSLAEYDAPHAAEYQTRGDAYCVRLKELDDYCRKAISSIPESQRTLVTAHDAFGYFSRAYEIPVRSAQGISTDSEAGVDDVNRLVEFISERKLKSIFVESSVNPRNLQAVIAGVKKQGHDVAIGGELFSDAMGPAGTYEGTYVGMIDHNATIIARALGGTAPERGMSGKLTESHAKP
jgi:manganese/zinc/iron transport system substrate-binding protein